MSEETLSEFIEELSKRDDPAPRDLIEKYSRLGLSAGDMAAATMARAALREPEVPESAYEESMRKIREMAERRAAEAPQPPPSLGARIMHAVRRLLGREP